MHRRDCTVITTCSTHANMFAKLAAVLGLAQEVVVTVVELAQELVVLVSLACCSDSKYQRIFC